MSPEVARNLHIRLDDLNAGKLRIVPVEQLPAVRVTAAEIEEYARTRSDWLTCKFCGLHIPDIAIAWLGGLRAPARRVADSRAEFDWRFEW